MNTAAQGRHHVEMGRAREMRLHAQEHPGLLVTPEARSKGESALEPATLQFGGTCRQDLCRAI